MPIDRTLVISYYSSTVTISLSCTISGILAHHFLIAWHRSVGLLWWSLPLTRPPPVYATTTGRPWLNSRCRSAILTCNEAWTWTSWRSCTTVRSQRHSATCCRFVLYAMPSSLRSVVYDDDCRWMKRQVPRVEREYRKAEPSRAADAAEVWRVQCRAYRDLLRRVLGSQGGQWTFASQSVMAVYWRLLGRCSAPANHDISADDFHRFFNQIKSKVAGVHESTSDASPPSFSSVLHFQPLSVDKYRVWPHASQSAEREHPVHVLAPLFYISL